MTETSVLIVGGGPVGHPKARGINARTMEIYRQLSVELVRPEGYVGWRRRAHAPDPSAELRSATRAILGHA